MLTGRRVLVTGASGFIGGRIVERLASERVSVRALLRDFGGGIRVARHPVEFAWADVTDLGAVCEAAAGCDVIIHCAFGTRGDAAERRAVTVEGTRNVLEAAVRTGARRVVHLSTVMVYGVPSDPVLRENLPRRASGDAYGDAKLEAEELVFRYQREQGLPVSVIQPTAVYGPFGVAWTERVLKQLRSKLVPLVDGGAGICNAVYVDDVAEAVLLAAEREQAVGEAFLISGEPITYRDFYERFARMIGGQRTVSMPADEVIDRWRKQRKRKGAVARALDRVRAGDPVHLPDPVSVRLQAQSATVSTEKARQLLGWEPSFDFETGADLTERWARWANLVPPAP